MSTIDSKKFWWFSFNLKEALNHPLGAGWVNILGNSTRMAATSAKSPRMWKIKLTSDQKFGNGGQASINDLLIPQEPLRNSDIPSYVVDYLNEEIAPELEKIGLAVTEFDVTVTCWSPKK